ncbi:MAG: hypothetical protein ACOYEV_02270 [Candidatus Nanopelagicales bacterium]
MGHLLGASVVAGGLDTEERIRLLASMHADLLPGSAISRPLPMPELSAWLGDREIVDSHS